MIEPDSIEVFLKKEFNYTEEQIADFKEWHDKNKDEFEKYMPYSKSGLYRVYVGHQVDRAKRNG